MYKATATIEGTNNLKPEENILSIAAFDLRGHDLTELVQV